MDFKEILTLFTLVGLIITAVGSWVLTKKQANDAEYVNNKQWEAIDKIKIWQQEHEKEAANHRLELQLKVAAHDGHMNVLSSQLTSIEAKLDALIKEIKDNDA